MSIRIIPQDELEKSEKRATDMIPPLLFPRLKNLYNRRAERLREAVQRAARGEQGHIAIGFTSSAALHPFVPNLLRRYRDILPGITTQLEEAGSGELMEALLEQRLDAAFVRSPANGIPGLSVEPVLSEPMIVALPLGHRLAPRTWGAIVLAGIGIAWMYGTQLGGGGGVNCCVGRCGETGEIPWPGGCDWP